MTKFEKLVYVGCPWFFGVVLIACGLIISTNPQAKLHGLLLKCTGLICMSFYCVCSILVKIVENKKDRVILKN